MAKWSVEVYDPNGDRVADISGKALTRRIVKTRNRSDTISLQYDLDDIKKLCATIGIDAFTLFAANQNEVRVKRDGTVISAGEIAEGEPVIDEDNRTISIQVVGWFDYFGAREVDSAVSFAATDAGDIAWSLINTAQARQYGDYGVTQGYIQPSVNRDRSYDSHKNIKDAIIQLSEVEQGFDFEITWDKKFNVFYPKQGSRRDDIILTYPGSIRKIRYKRTGIGMANEITARGAGTGEDTFQQTAIDEVSASAYHLRQKTVDFSDVSVEATLLEHANEELTFAAKFTDVPTVVLDSAKAPPFGSYGLGDELRINVTKDLEIFGTVNDYFRIDSMQIDLDENNNEDITLNMMK